MVWGRLDGSMVWVGGYAGGNERLHTHRITRIPYAVRYIRVGIYTKNLWRYPLTGD